ncbi:MAG: VOC family protein [Liquorilactobacillus hordei]|uniref:SMU1112c/YaeR family gloxylase I-like metalloprotein n=1 Tax=Liquorilactobacillus hordei TaxID=468911 RepID=UPI0039EC5A2E
MIFESIHHIAIICHNREEALDFYVKKLGFAIISDYKRVEKNDEKIDLEKQNLRLELFIKPNAPERLSYPIGEGTGLRHLAFKVSNIEEIVEELKAKEIRVEKIRRDDFTGEKMTFFFDPDGLPLELHE